MRRWALGFIAGVLGCASSGTPPVGAPLQVWARAEVGQGCEPDAEDRCVATLCTGTECALFFCEDLASSGIVRTRATAPVFVAPGGTAQRNWGSAQGLPGDRQPVMVFRWYPQERLPSEVRRQQAMEEWARRPKEKHHLFPQQYTAYFLSKGINVHDYVMAIDKDLHARIHRGPDGAPWNGEWRMFFSRTYGRATKPQHFEQASKMIQQFGLFGLTMTYWQSIELGPFPRDD
ncbi:TIGR02269 family lipoprotein [Corallococcus sp. AB004]|uniref:SitA6 family polymorphic toxin lipoprotein n=1 Tax=Corallococcus sp. AB038B TaxID=2316718 RepID=UPI000EA0F10B|nr:TIGR02269 family lipoprotein [Corallococcus sp. AB038B]RKH94093.1 TIGR02269 family lipoprotein [Corallococcus sp. AB038B]RKI35356.1 TIGR02269 family lipoprotein [Corallococcus sp. AB004]